MDERADGEDHGVCPSARRIACVVASRWRNRPSGITHCWLDSGYCFKHTTNTRRRSPFEETSSLGYFLLYYINYRNPLMDLPFEFPFVDTVTHK